MTPFFDPAGIDIKTFEAVCGQSVDGDTYPHARRIEKNVPMYDGDLFRDLIGDHTGEQKLQAELHRVLRDGPGVFVIQRMYDDLAVIDACTGVFEEIIRDEKESGYGQGDHFGSNERIWNSLQKVCLRAPELFCYYYGSPVLATVSLAWLGPFYQITAQVNNVKPGSESQQPHRDYHLGFQASEDVPRFPASIQVASQFLTLQGAVAHTEMPLESGPTLLLPFSQQYPEGYMAYSDPAFASYFKKHCVQLPLKKGDGLFFNPALFHGAGTNRSTMDRMANLLQVSSAMGRPMESIDRDAMVKKVYPFLRTQYVDGGFTERMVRDVIAALADGYSFPTNLDTDPPSGGYAPRTAQQLLARALEEAWSQEELERAVDSYAERRNG